MERRTNTDGTLASSWQSTDSYGPWLGGADLWGSPGGDNSAGLPDAGVYCGPKTNLLVQSAPPGPSFNPGTSGCTYLARFITGNTFGAVRYGGLYEGDVASSTGGAGSFGKALAYAGSVSIPAGTATGTHFFFAIWEVRSFANDGSDFNTFFTNGSIPAQHGNYITIPFTYAP
jgi:hypothetical protein